MRLRHDDDPPETVRDRQFGIRQVMILTFIVAVVLGVCRMVAVQSAPHFATNNSGEIAVFALLAAAGVAMTLPLLLAALLPRWSTAAVGVVLVLIGLGTWYELPLLNLIFGGGPDIWHLTFINAFQAVWVLAVAAIVRTCGYGIGRPAEQFPFANEPGNTQEKAAMWE
jgi:hypothetical protein